MGIFKYFKSKQPKEFYHNAYNPAYQMFQNGKIIKSESNKNESGLYGLLSSSSTQVVSTEKMLASYSNNVIDYACVFAISNTIADLPYKIYRLDKDGQEVDVVDNELANTMLNRPSKMWSWYDFIEMTTTLLELTGFCVVESVFPNEPKELFPLRSDLVEVVVGRDGVIGYKYSLGTQQITFNKDEAFQIKYANPTDFNRGFSAYVPMRQQQAIDYQSLKYTNAFFENGGHLDGFINAPIALPKTKKEELYAQYEEQFTGSKAFRMMLLDKGFEYTKNQVDPKEADVSAIRNMQRGDIITGRGCYPIVLGFLDGASYANANIQWKLFYRNTIKPKAQKIQDALNMNVFSKYGVKFKFDFTTVPELKDDETEKAITLKAYMESGGATINESRRAVNLPPLPDGDVLPVKQTPNISFGKSDTDLLLEDIKKKSQIYQS